MRQVGRSFLHSPFIAALALAWAAAEPAPVWAQDVESASDAQESSGEGSAGEPAAPAGDAVEESSSPISGWFRFDVDSLGPQFWFGATHEIGGLAIASDIYVDDAFAELDLGVALTFGNLSLTPMAGFGVNFQTYQLTTLIAPQLFTTYIQGPIYVDSWIQFFINSPFDDAGRDVFYFRAFVVYKLTEYFGIGPQVETSIFLDESVEGAGDGGLAALPIGAQFNVGYGENRTLGLFLGYDTRYEGEGDGIAGRFTFVQTW